MHPMLRRLDDLAAHLAARPDTVALLGLGSAGVDHDRLDAHSDLDFFLVVEDGALPRYVESLDWLAAPCPVAYSFANERNGRKALYADGTFVEYAVFTVDELARLPSAGVRVVWQRPDAPAGLAECGPPPRPATPYDTVEFHLNEALTNLYVGLHRELRGERLSASRFIQSYAVDRVLALLSLTPPRWRIGGTRSTRAAGWSRRTRRRCCRWPRWCPATWGDGRLRRSARWCARHATERLAGQDELIRGILGRHPVWCGGDRHQRRTAASIRSEAGDHTAHCYGYGKGRLVGHVHADHGRLLGQLPGPAGGVDQPYPDPAREAAVLPADGLGGDQHRIPQAQPVPEPLVHANCGDETAQLLVEKERVVVRRIVHVDQAEPEGLVAVPA
ncbi:hypothetical protein AB0C02_18015 [Micromonospora sp. NPDC048999]|uniref:hypothetical protein n=1 Tax=Micromonospora sp. NPDC048999 TaxID=3155391 RepID=UPI0033C95265